MKFLVSPSTGGKFSAVTDNKNGTYTATFTAGTKPGTYTITATIGGQTVTAKATVTVGTGSALESRLEPAQAGITAVTSTTPTAADAALRALLLDDSTLTGKPRALVAP